MVIQPVPYYTERAAFADASAVTLELLARRLSWARLTAALAAVACVYYNYHGLPTYLAWPVGLVAVVAFLILVAAHRRTAARAAYARNTATACRAGLARCARDWANIPPARLARSVAGRAATASDLGILGEISLFRLLDVTSPALGGTLVLEWLLSDAAALATIVQRQESVAELRSRPDYLVESALVGRHGSYARSAATSSALHSFVDWCANDRTVDGAWQPRSGISIACAALIIGLGIWHPPGVAKFIIGLVLLQLFVASRARKTLTTDLAGLGSLLPQLRGLDASMRLIAEEANVAGAFGTVQESLRREGAASSLGKLDTILVWNDMHLTPMAHFPLNAIFAVDVHIAAALQRWRARSGIHVASWVDLTRTAQALTALATVAYENPEWTIPSVSDDVSDPAFHAAAATHPVLAPSTAVANPVRIATSGSLLSLSGSNMSGKTTYLRAIGLNAALAFAGGAVSATNVILRRARLRTSVRIEDDLGAGVSLFLAEVSRLRDIVRDGEEGNAPPVLFLFDEILHGTNAADRHYASQVVLRRLLLGGNWGVLTTHDADLVVGLFGAPDPEHASRVEQGHFRETVQRDGAGVRMSFDYLLRPGATTSANARVILEMMGLDAWSSSEKKPD
ncbi:MAG: hypothetical protein ABJE47_18485 [bacterium]